MIRLPRTIRLDASDTIVFTHPAEPGEWAVSGSFLFAGRPQDSLTRKERIALRSGFLGVSSFGHSTLVVVTEATPTEREAMVEALAAQFVAHLGAPDHATARPAAEEEVDFAEDICRGHSINTLIALHRSMEEDGAIREQFRTLKPREQTAFGASYLQGHDRAFSIVEMDDEDEEHHIDLLNLRGDGT